MRLATLINNVRNTLQLDDGTYLIGRGEKCRISIPFPDISERHAILIVRDGTAILEDLHSANGTFVNNSPISGPVKLDKTMIIQIGSAMLRVFNDDEAEETPAQEPKESEPESEIAEEEVDPMRELRRNVQEQIHKELLKRLDLKRLTMDGVDAEGLEEMARCKISEIIDEVVAKGRLPEGIDSERLENDVFNEAMRLGPLEELLADDSVA